MDAVDDDTLAAVRRLYQADRQDLPTLVAQPGTQAGRLKSQPLPYVAAESKAGKHTFMTGGPRIDKRTVTLTAYGTKADVELILGVLLELFHSECVLNYPSGSHFVGWLPASDGKVEQDPTTKTGLDVWRGILEGEAWSSRTS